MLCHLFRPLPTCGRSWETSSVKQNHQGSLRNYPQAFTSAGCFCRELSKRAAKSSGERLGPAETATFNCNRYEENINEIISGNRPNNQADNRNVSETVQTVRAQSNRNTFTNKHQMGRDFFSIWKIHQKTKIGKISTGTRKKLLNLNWGKRVS